MELYYGVSGMGAVLHTINPRLFPEQIAYIVNHAEDQYLFFDLTFAPLIEKLAPQMKSVKGFVAMTDRAHMPALVRAESALLRGADRRPRQRLRVAGTRREHRVVAVLHVRHDGQSQGRAVFAPLDGAAFVRRVHGRQPGHFRCGERCCWWCRCSTSTPGACRMRARCPAPSWCCPGPALDGKSVYELMRDEKVTLALGVPTVWLMLLQHVEASGLDPKADLVLRQVVIGGSAAPRAMSEKFETKFGAFVVHAWGMTEMSPLGTVCNLLAQARRLHAGAAPRRAGEAGPAHLRRRHEDHRRRRTGVAARRQGLRPPDGPRPVDHAAATSRETAERFSTPTGISTPVTSPPSTPTATCRSPIGRRT